MQPLSTFQFPSLFNSLHGSSVASMPRNMFLAENLVRNILWHRSSLLFQQMLDEHIIKCPEFLNPSCHSHILRIFKTQSLGYSRTSYLKFLTSFARLADHCCQSDSNIFLSFRIEVYSIVYSILSMILADWREEFFLAARNRAMNFSACIPFVRKGWRFISIDVDVTHRHASLNSVSLSAWKTTTKFLTPFNSRWKRGIFPCNSNGNIYGNIIKESVFALLDKKLNKIQLSRLKQIEARKMIYSFPLYNIITWTTRR